MSNENLAFALVILGLVVGVLLSTPVGILMVVIGVLILVWPRITRGQP
jgi:hypothetical protein